MAGKTTVVAFLLAGAACGLAQQFEISRSTIDSGGATRSNGGVFELSGTIGQPDAGLLTGGPFDLTGGFWFATPPGDCDESGHADLMDHGHFTQCLGGPGGELADGCECADQDQSGTIDLRDFALINH